MTMKNNTKNKHILNKARTKHYILCSFFSFCKSKIRSELEIAKEKWKPKQKMMHKSKQPYLIVLYNRNHKLVGQKFPETVPAANEQGLLGTYLEKDLQC